MTQSEFNKLTFSQRHEISKETLCNASWQVRTLNGNLHAISCRNCGTVLQSDCTPKCLMNINQPTGINLHVMQAEGSDVSEGAAVGQRSGGTVVEGIEVINIKTGQLINVEGYGFMFGKDLNTGEIKCFNIDNVSEPPSGEQP